MIRNVLAATVAVSCLVPVGIAVADGTEASPKCLIAAPQYDAIWRRGTGDQVLEMGLPWSRFLAKDDELRAAGWRLQDIDAEIQPTCEGTGQVGFTAVWTFAPQIEEARVFGWGDLDFAWENFQMNQDGWRLHLVDTYRVGSQVLYNGVWRRGDHQQDDLLGWNWNDFTAEANRRLSEGWRIRAFDVYLDRSRQYVFNSSWVRGDVGRFGIWGWAQRDFDGKYAEVQPQGWNLVALSQVPAVGRWSAWWEFTQLEETRTSTSGSDRFRRVHRDMHAAGWQLVMLSPSY